MGANTILAGAAIAAIIVFLMILGYVLVVRRDEPRLLFTPHMNADPVSPMDANNLLMPTMFNISMLEGNVNPRSTIGGGPEARNTTQMIRNGMLFEPDAALTAELENRCALEPCSGNAFANYPTSNMSGAPLSYSGQNRDRDKSENFCGYRANHPNMKCLKDCDPLSGDDGDYSTASESFTSSVDPKDVMEGFNKTKELFCNKFTVNGCGGVMQGCDSGVGSSKVIEPFNKTKELFCNKFSMNGCGGVMQGCDSGVGSSKVIEPYGSIESYDSVEGYCGLESKVMYTNHPNMACLGPHCPSREGYTVSDPYSQSPTVYMDSWDTVGSGGVGYIYQGSNCVACKSKPFICQSSDYQQCQGTPKDKKSIYEAIIDATGEIPPAGDYYVM